ncbi:hypothetical protein [Moraxella pluranimalium]|uniref:Uncharacterized protein n=1 Tax=Moraxella pluranimalium TaxID=470453 RepID=A0A1T0CPP9_9GAMM|nr:hypothetical protein [Moraxella pluranimalium]OOS24229.1 hypothetical protein B0680_05470 [Moraxella pluranimalium]
MKRLVLPVMAWLCSSMAYANTHTDCDTMELAFANTETFGIDVIYTTKATFPNPPQKVVLNSFQGYDFACHGVSISNTADGFVLRSSDLVKTLKSFKKDRDGIVLNDDTSYKYPHIQMGLQPRVFAFNPQSLRLEYNHSTLRTKKMQHGYYAVYDTDVMAYRVNGGELLPLLYRGEISSYAKDFDRANELDIYYQSSEKSVHININKANNELSVTKNVPMPSK